MFRTAVSALVVCVSVAVSAARVVPSRVTLLATPNEGIQPQAAIDSHGTLHLIYFKGEASAGDLYYVSRTRDSARFSTPIRVNSQPGTVMATGSVRGGHLAIGRTGWIHVAWDAARAVEADGAKYTPMYYTRLAPPVDAFEPQRAIGRPQYLDGGTIAADQFGHVHLVWHAPGAREGEAHREVFIASSSDDGAHFEAEKPLVAEGGVCSCCAIAALADRAGRLNVLYRAATDNIHRDATWVVVDGRSQHSERLGAWELNACPMTTFALAQAPDGLIGAWQTEHQIFFAALDPARATHATVQTVNATGTLAHPAVAVNRAGERLIAWTDGTAWARGGTMSWELRSAAGAREDGAEHVAPVPVWGLVSAVARPDGSFVIVY